MYSHRHSYKVTRERCWCANLISSRARTHTIRVLKLDSLIAHGLRTRDNTRPRDYSTRHVATNGVDRNFAPTGVEFRPPQQCGESERERERERRVLSADVPPSPLTSRAYNTCRDRVCARCVPLHLSEAVRAEPPSPNSANAVFIEEVTLRDVREQE